MLDKIEALKEEALEALRATSSLDDLDHWRVEYLGRKGGAVTQLLRGVGKLSPEERPVAGQAGNELKTVLAEALENRRAELSRPVGERADSRQVVTARESSRKKHGS